MGPDGALGKTAVSEPYRRRLARDRAQRALHSGYLRAIPFRDAMNSPEGTMSRLFGFLSVIIVMAIGLYIYSQQMQSSSAAAGASNPRAAIDITGVKADLISIASGERRYFATEGKYASLDELISSKTITVVHERPPYSYEVQVSGNSFHVVATRSGDNTGGTPAQLSVDDNMQFQTSE